jgi:hypothetical protein
MYTLIDGDVLVYSCGFASQTNEYTANNSSFQYKKDVNSYCDSHGIDRSLITKNIIPSPVSHALQNVKQALGSIAQACDSNDGQIYLTGKGNYRHKAATTHPYKGNRDPDHKPVHYQAIIDYLLNTWDAEMVEGMEADDAMGIAQWKNLEDSKKFPFVDEYTCICTIDKDLDMIPGWHYNFRKEEKYRTNLEESDFFFYKQMLTGDRVDNIIGIKGIGEVKAHKLLFGKSAEEMENTIIKKYKAEFGKDYISRYHENETLLWILREPLDG